jgi:hypothetical protein
MNCDVNELCCVVIATGSPLPLSAVPEEVQTAFRSVYLPPLVDSPALEEAVVKAAPSAPSSSAGSSLLASAPSTETASEVLVSQVAEKRSVADISSPAPALSGPPQSDSEGAKKKRRIVPVAVSPSQPLAPPSAVLATEAPPSDSICSTETAVMTTQGGAAVPSSAPDASAAVAKKVKKRIAPVLVGDAVSLPQLLP